MNTKLKLALMKCGKHQYEIALEAGINETALSRIVLGRRKPTTDERRNLAAALGVRDQDLFSPDSGRGSMPRTTR